MDGTLVPWREPAHTQPGQERGAGTWGWQWAQGLWFPRSLDQGRLARSLPGPHAWHLASSWAGPSSAVSCPCSSSCGSRLAFLSPGFSLRHNMVPEHLLRSPQGDSDMKLTHTPINTQSFGDLEFNPSPLQMRKLRHIYTPGQETDVNKQLCFFVFIYVF